MAITRVGVSRGRHDRDLEEVNPVKLADAVGTLVSKLCTRVA
jgi:hypothetical protein